MSDPISKREEQRRSWDRFYSENDRPWRGIGKLSGLIVEKGDKALDLGCGNGKTVAVLLQEGAFVTGLDLSETAVEYCRKMFLENANFIVSDCSDLPFDDDTFDIVTLVHVLEHLDDEQLCSTVSEICRVLVSGGKVLVRSFAVGDMRAEGSDSNVRGNGIAYRYFTLNEIENIFKGMNVIKAETISERMRFGGTRVRVECIFEKVGYFRDSAKES
jgi:ubiquinone/menaquinone biosynthesis C-methylase UbiE